MTYRVSAQGGTYFNPDDIRPATASHQGLMSKEGFAKLAALYQAYPRCVLRHSVNQALANNTVTNLTYDTEVADTHGFHDPAVNPDRITIPTGLGGTYLVGHHAHWAANIAGSRLSYITDSGGTDLDIGWVNASQAQQMSTRALTILALAAGFYVVSRGFQNSGGALNALGGLTYAPYFWLVRLGD